MNTTVQAVPRLIACKFNGRFETDSELQGRFTLKRLGALGAGCAGLPDPRVFFSPPGSRGRRHECDLPRGHVVGNAVAREFVRTFLQARFSGAERHRRGLAKVASLKSTEDIS
jgi:hypothetical protein